MCHAACLVLLAVATWTWGRRLVEMCRLAEKGIATARACMHMQAAPTADRLSPNCVVSAWVQERPWAVSCDAIQPVSQWSDGAWTIYSVVQCSARVLKDAVCMDRVNTLTKPGVAALYCQ